MKLTPIVYGIMILGSGVWAQAHAADFGRGLSVTPGGGYYAFDSKQGIDDDSFPSIAIEYRFTKSLGLELNYLATDTVEARNNLAKFEVEQIRLDGNYYFSPDKKLQPYMSAGVGSMSVDQPQKRIERDDTVADVGAGIRYFINKSFSLRGDLRAVNNFDSGYTDGMLNVGVNFLFGGNSKTTDGDIDIVDAAPSMGVGGPALASSDFDGDGVLNAKDDCLNTDAGMMVDENGCAIPVESTVSMDLNVNFEFESANLPPEFYSDVKELATFLKSYDNSVVTIEGHADATGPETYNQQLSEKRAKAIRDILVKDFNVEVERLNFVGFGEAKPVASNQTKEGRSKNRRAATVVTATRKLKTDSATQK